MLSTVSSGLLQSARVVARRMTVHPSVAVASDAEKQAARKRMQAALRQLSQEQMREESEAIVQRVLRLDLFRQAKQLAIYVHCARLREVDTTAVLEAALARAGTRVFVPRVQDQDANMHFLHLDTMDALHPVPPFGIREPHPVYHDGRPRQDVFSLGQPLDLVVMPGLSFNARGHRLGRGGGYYDKFIDACHALAASQGRPPPLLLALAFEVQMVDAVPVADNDEDVDVIVTAKGVLRCTERARRLLPPGAAEEQCGEEGAGGGG